MVKIGGQKTRPNTLVSAASVRGRTLADKVYWSEARTERRSMVNGNHDVRDKIDQGEQNIIR